ncbi:MAG: hypothetical protein WBA76_04845 [Phormidesmis sp.]
MGARLMRLSAVAIALLLVTHQAAARGLDNSPDPLADLSLDELEKPPEDLAPPEEQPEASPPADSDTGEERSGTYLRSPSICPSDIEPLTAALIRDIPNYTNRVLQRTVAVLPNSSADSLSDSIARAPYRPSYVLIAGRPELEPLDLSNYALTTDPEAGGPLTQVFFTTLSRQYSGLRVNEVQEYHWLFLAQVPDGWWLAFMFSAIDDADTVRSPLPPRENSEGSVGQAVQLWLRDCRAGVIDRLD